DYLFRYRFDAVGRYRSDPDAAPALVKNLASDLNRIRAEQAVPAGMTDDLLRQRLALLLTSDALGPFIAAITGNAESVASTDNVPADQAIDPKLLAGDPRLRLDYDTVLERQRLTSRGLLLNAKKDQLGQGNAALGVLLGQVQPLGFQAL